MNETKIQAQIIQYLRTRHIFAWRNNTRVVYVGGRPIRFGAPGSPDILGVLRPDGKLLAIEVKKPGEKPNPIQAEFLANLANDGALVIVAQELEDVIVALVSYGYGVILGTKKHDNLPEKK